MDRIRYLLEEKKFLETHEEALLMQNGEWESRYVHVLQELNAEEKKHKRSFSSL